MNKQRNEKRTCRYVNLMTDSGFKAVFADKSNKELLIGLLNHVLTEAEQYNALLPVHLTAITSFKCPHDDEKLWNSDEFISRYRMAEERTGEFVRPTIFVNFVELERFTKSA